MVPGLLNENLLSHAYPPNVLESIITKKFICEKHFDYKLECNRSFHF
jgi:hypothetical protein